MDQGQRENRLFLLRFVTDSEIHELILRKTFSGAEGTQDLICEVFNCQLKCKINAQKEEGTLSSIKSMDLETWKTDVLVNWVHSSFYHYLVLPGPCTSCLNEDKNSL